MRRWILSFPADSRGESFVANLFYGTIGGLVGLAGLVVMVVKLLGWFLRIILTFFGLIFVALMIPTIFICLLVVVILGALFGVVMTAIDGIINIFRD